MVLFSRWIVPRGRRRPLSSWPASSSSSEARPRATDLATEGFLRGAWAALADLEGALAALPGRDGELVAALAGLAAALAALAGLPGTCAALAGLTAEAGRAGTTAGLAGRLDTLEAGDLARIFSAARAAAQAGQSTRVETTSPLAWGLNSVPHFSQVDMVGPLVGIRISALIFALCALSL